MDEVQDHWLPIQSLRPISDPLLFAEENHLLSLFLELHRAGFGKKIVEANNRLVAIH